ncbi:RNA-directed DNA polymerase, eukaryota [Tanacetum coccineum]
MFFLEVPSFVPYSFSYSRMTLSCSGACFARACEAAGLMLLAAICRLLLAERSVSQCLAVSDPFGLGPVTCRVIWACGLVNTNEDQTQKISKSVFITNFPDHTRAQDLWNVCNAYGSVIDVYIPNKRSKSGKRFAFVRFITVSNLECLIKNLCTIWIGSYHLYANKVRFLRDQKQKYYPYKNDFKSGKDRDQFPDAENSGNVRGSFASVLKGETQKQMLPVHVKPALVLEDSCLKERDFRLSLMGQVKEKFCNHVGVGSWFSMINAACNSFVSEERIVWISIEGLPINSWTTNTFSKWGELVVWEESEENSLSFYWIRAKELHAWIPKFHSYNDDSSSENNSTIPDEEFKFGDYEKETPIVDSDVEQKDDLSQSEDTDFTHPPGFTPNIEKWTNSPKDHVKSSPSMKSFISHNVEALSHRINSIPTAGGSFLEVMDKLVQMNFMSLNIQGLGHKAKKRWIQELCSKNKINFVALQETKSESIDLFSIKALWGNLSFDHAMSPTVGNSGGILCVWDPNMFITEHVSSYDYFLAVMGTWSPSATKLLIIFVYAPQELTEKRHLWDYLRSMIDRWDGETIILGDFNEVRSNHERFGSSFNTQGANVFNNFISMAGLIDLPLGGYSFTWTHKSASKMSKLDRFLISEGLLVLFPQLTGLCLDKHLSDHRPIIMYESNMDYGPSPFRLFHSWFKIEGFDKFVEDTWRSMNTTDLNGLIRMKKKLQFLKNAIKPWVKDNRKKINEAKTSIQRKLIDVGKIIDQGGGNEEVLNQRTSLMKDLSDINSSEVLDFSQKAKVCWSIKGDENSKYFHGILNSKRSQLAIRGILLDGDWIVEPKRIKTEFYNHFANQFLKPRTTQVKLEFEFPNQLNSEQVEDLERPISYDEIKTAVWDCGKNKSPGLMVSVLNFFESIGILWTKTLLVRFTSSLLLVNFLQVVILPLLPLSPRLKMQKLSKIFVQ